MGGGDTTIGGGDTTIGGGDTTIGGGGTTIGGGEVAAAVVFAHALAGGGTTFGGGEVAAAAGSARALTAGGHGGKAAAGGYAHAFAGEPPPMVGAYVIFGQPAGCGTGGLCKGWQVFGCGDRDRPLWVIGLAAERCASSK